MLKEIREKSGLTQSQAAKKMKVNVGFWNRIEAGSVDLPTKYFKRASKTLKVPMKKLINLRVDQFTKKLKAKVDGKRRH